MNFRRVPAVMHHLNSVQYFASIRIYPKCWLLLSTRSNYSSSKKEISSQSISPQTEMNMKVSGSLTREQYLEFQARSKAIIATRWRRQLYLWLSGNFGLLARMFIPTFRGQIP